MRKKITEKKYWHFYISLIGLTLILTQCLPHGTAPVAEPIFPIALGCEETVPVEFRQRLRTEVEKDKDHIIWTESEESQVVIGLSEEPGSKRIGTWTYAVAAPFFTVSDEISSAIIKQLWQAPSDSSNPPDPLWGQRPLLMTEETLAVLSSKWGIPTGALVQTVDAPDLLNRAVELEAWAILPFHQLTPKWKTLRVDGISLLEKNEGVASYPLNVSFYARSDIRRDALDLPFFTEPARRNREESSMTIIAMTGVTAMARRTAQLMDRSGLTYPARDIKHWFSDADFVHISNEVSFNMNYTDEGLDTMSFSSKDSYIELLESINTNVIELTGNHLLDKGIEPLQHTLEMYRERGWSWYGGGANSEEASRPLMLIHGNNRIALLGRNTFDGPGRWASDDSPGVASTRLPGSSALDLEKMESLKNLIGALKADGFQVILTLQYYETYHYLPYPQQISDFRTFAEMGADYVQGSQAHQPQTMEFHGDCFIHYGLGNLFFDQMWSTGTRQEFVNRLVFYDGKLLNVDLRTALLEENGRPRPMTVGDSDPAGDRAAFLKMIFELRQELQM